MPFINNEPIISPYVEYGGHIIPPKPPLAPLPPQNTTINYDGQSLTSIPAKPVQQVVNASNNPSSIIIGNGQLNGVILNGDTFASNIQLPLDTIIVINGKKILAESQIIDGVSVFEHISRKPYQIDFEFTIRPDGTVKGQGQPGTIYPFPQITMNNLWTFWNANTVYSISNTYLNGIGISSIIFESITPATVRGSLNIPCKLKCYENQTGQTIIMP